MPGEGVDGPPWDGGGVLDERQGGWRPVMGPSAIPFDEGFPAPVELSKEDITGVVLAFARAAERAIKAGFKIIEIHAAHGYLLHEFLSPVTNKRTDNYGGSFENRFGLSSMWRASCAGTGRRPSSFCSIVDDRLARG